MLVSQGYELWAVYRTPEGSGDCDLVVGWSFDDGTPEFGTPPSPLLARQGLRQGAISYETSKLEADNAATAVGWPDV